jgi:hypothetical protein
MVVDSDALGDNEVAGLENGPLLGRKVGTGIGVSEGWDDG